MNIKILFSGTRTFLFLGMKFGFVGSVIGLTLHAIWGNLEAIVYTVGTGFLIGFSIGCLELIFSNTKIIRLPYPVILLFRIITYFIITLVCVYIFLIVYLKATGYGTTALSNPNKFKEISKIYFLANINTIYILIFTLTATFIWQLKSFFVKGVLINYLTGKYHRPSIEERIFMFLDLNDATTIAEHLGSKTYSSFLSDFFKDIDSAFVKNKGQIFQYVGDEVVVIWKLNSGLKNNNCINAYFSAVKILEKKKQYYLDKYNMLPSFKASVHVGKVTITEVGISKKEIVYHGDSINTASRICSIAHSLGKKFIISKALHDKLSNDRYIHFEELGEYSLKGKNEKIHLYGM